MNDKKIIGKKTIILFILTLFFLASNILYYRYINNKNKEAAVNAENEKSEICQKIVTGIIDGVFKKIENNLLYIIPRDEDELKSIPLKSGTIFVDLFLSSLGQPLEQKEISQNDLKPGDELSLIISYEENAPDKFTAQTVRRMITLEFE